MAFGEEYGSEKRKGKDGRSCLATRIRNKCAFPVFSTLQLFYRFYRSMSGLFPSQRAVLRKGKERLRNKGSYGGNEGRRAKEGCEDGQQQPASTWKGKNRNRKERGSRGRKERKRKIKIEKREKGK